MIVFLDELGNFKQNIFTLQSVIFFYILQQLCMYVFTNTKLHIEYYYHPTLAHQQTSTLKKGPAGNLSSLSAFAIIVVGP